METDGPAVQRALELRLFGRVQLTAWGDSTPILLPHKAEELLAYLVVAPPGPHPRHSVAEALWSDAHGDVNKQLRQALWRLRAALKPHAGPDEPIRVDHGWIECARMPGFRVDLWELQRLVEPRRREDDPASGSSAIERALAVDEICSRPLLEGWTNPWAVEARDWARERHLKALEEIVQWHRASAEHERALEVADRALHLDSSIEALHRERIRAYLELGDRVGAARAFQRCLDVLRTEWGLEPTAETVGLGRRALESREESA